MKLNTHPFPVSSLRMSGGMPSLHHMPSCCTQVQFYHTFSCSNHTKTTLQLKVSDFDATCFLCYVNFWYDEETVVHNHPYYRVCPDILSPVRDPLLGNGCGSLNHTCTQLFLFVSLLILYSVQRKGVLYKVTSKSHFIQITRSLALTHITLIRDFFPPLTASVRYRLPAVILFKFLSVPSLLSITNGP